MTNHIRKIETIREFHIARGLSTPLHPLISLIDYSKTKILPEYLGEKWNLGFYSIGVKRNVETIRYGQQEYDFNEGLMSFISPGQLLSISPNTLENKKPSGWLLLIHPDFLWNTSLAKSIDSKEFFGYSINEALFMSKKEEETVEEIFQFMKQEIETNVDHYSQQIIIAQIELLLQYAERFYHRQFITRKKNNHLLLNQIEELLNSYFKNDCLVEKGLPTVSYLAQSIHLSPNYLSSVLKSISGLNAQQFIHKKIINEAKRELSTTSLSISEIAYKLGFEHSQSFSKLFKSKTAQTPSKFRKQFI